MAQSKRVDTQLTGRLFPKSPIFRIVQLGRDDARKKSDDLHTLENLLLESEAMYPGIDHWYAEKVVPGLKNLERIAYVAFESEKPIASAVLKLGVHAKFCHVRIHEGFRDLELGQMFFTQMAFEARHYIANDIHFTLPEGLWHERAEFFNSFGFTAAVKASRQYRNGETELSCSAPLATVWQRALQKLPHLLLRFSPAGYSVSNKLLLSMRPEFAERVFALTKHVEIRRKFSRKWKGCKAVVYGSKPIGALMGEVTLSDVVSGSPANIWKLYGARAGCSQKEYENYVGNSPEVYAIELGDIAPYMAPVGIAQISHLISEDLRPPQSFLDVKMNSNNAWTRAINVAGLLHSRFGVRQPMP